jgi:hypothetical protein
MQKFAIEKCEHSCRRLRYFYFSLRIRLNEDKNTFEDERGDTKVVDIGTIVGTSACGLPRQVLTPRILIAIWLASLISLLLSGGTSCVVPLCIVFGDSLTPPVIHSLGNGW